MTVPVMFMVLSLLYLCSSQQIFVGPKYQAEPNAQKANEIEEQISKDSTPGSYPTLELPEIFVESMPVSFDTEADDMPYQFVVQRRPKLIHSVGAIATAIWVPENNTYTGVFQGCKNLFIRFSSATAPTNASRGFTPGISLKCTRTGVPSANILAMYSLEGQDGYNFFKHDLSNHPPDLSENAPFILKELKSHFETASAWPTMIGLTSFASYDEDGNLVGSPQFPFRLIFHPVTAYHKAYPDTFPTDGFENVLARLLRKGPLYYVYAQDQPSDTPDQFKVIGQIVINADSANTSNFGDNYMFFQHTRMEDDFAFYPAWVPFAQKIVEEQQKTDYYTFPDLPFN